MFSARSMEGNPKTLLVILNHNSLSKMGGKALSFIHSIASTDYPNLEIVVVDNASTDGSDKTIEEELKRLGRGTVVRARTNMGYAGGNNYGFKLYGKNCKYIAFLNNDIEVEPDWLRKIIEVMESDEKIAAAQPMILQLSRRELLDSLGGTIDRLGRAYDIGSGLKPPQEIKNPLEVFYARGAAIVVRRNVFELLNGFDEDYFIYYEETDFCWRARLLGYRVVTVPTARVYHLGGATSGGATPQTIHLRRRNQLTTLVKNYSAGNAILYTTLLTAIYLTTAARRALNRSETQISNAIISAILWNLRHLRKTIRKRAEIQAMRKLDDKKLSKHMLGIRDYNRLARYLPRSY
jgi:GT2 family glycosyltransferase